MTISIIVRTRNEEGTIDTVLKSIFAQVLEQEFEVILVDSGSGDRTLEIARRYEVKILSIPASEFSYGYALNYGIRHSSGDILCCLSAHCVPRSNTWLSELIKPITEGRAGATYGRQVPVKGINPFEELFLRRRFPEEEVGISGRIPFSNANCAFIRKMWDEVNFDERISSWEDYLWYLLTKDRFVFRYIPNACVIHSHTFSISRLARTAYMDGKAFRDIKDTYGFDILESIPSLSGKLKYAINDMADHALFFLQNGYARCALALPFVKLYSYLNYWRGYHHSRVEFNTNGSEGDRQ